MSHKTNSPPLHWVPRCIVLLVLAVVSAPRALAHPVPAAPLMEADHFDTGISSWSSAITKLSWSDRDASGQSDSGSIEVIGIVDAGLHSRYGEALACTTNVARGAVHQLRAHVYVTGDPELLSPGHEAHIELAFFRDRHCELPVDGDLRVSSEEVTDFNTWQEARVTAKAPSDARSVLALLAISGWPENIGYFDDVTLESGFVAPPSSIGWITSPTFDRLRFQVRITPPSGSELQGIEVADCLADTVCFGGALPDRAELEIRFIGPRPNGFIWPVITQLTPSEVEIWIEKRDTGELRYYRLSSSAGSDVLSGFFDRYGFLPPLD